MILWLKIIAWKITLYYVRHLALPKTRLHLLCLWFDRFLCQESGSKLSSLVLRNHLHTVHPLWRTNDFLPKQEIDHKVESTKNCKQCNTDKQNLDNDLCREPSEHQIYSTCEIFYLAIFSCIHPLFFHNHQLLDCQNKIQLIFNLINHGFVITS